MQKSTDSKLSIINIMQIQRYSSYTEVDIEKIVIFLVRMVFNLYTGVR